ncbi:hypothetical protein FB451DRAFT_1287205 [Mycena latifolia]|nr:hypothetical protein FB451DRAFT_1287205 [Mycena latifolia]
MPRLADPMNCLCGKPLMRTPKEMTLKVCEECAILSRLEDIMAQPIALPPDPYRPPAMQKYIQAFRPKLVMKPADNLIAMRPTFPSTAAPLPLRKTLKTEPPRAPLQQRKQRQPLAPKSVPTVNRLQPPASPKSPISAKYCSFCLKPKPTVCHLFRNGVKIPSCHECYNKTLPPEDEPKKLSPKELCQLHYLQDHPTHGPKEFTVFWKDQTPSFRSNYGRSGNLLRQWKPVKPATAKTLCMQHYYEDNPDATEADFKVYWKDQSPSFRVNYASSAKCRERTGRLTSRPLCEKHYYEDHPGATPAQFNKYWFSHSETWRLTYGATKAARERG